MTEAEFDLLHAKGKPWTKLVVPSGRMAVLECMIFLLACAQLGIIGRVPIGSTQNIG